MPKSDYDDDDEEEEEEETLEASSFSQYSGKSSPRSELVPLSGLQNANYSGRKMHRNPVDSQDSSMSIFSLRNDEVNGSGSGKVLFDESYVYLAPVNLVFFMLTVQLENLVSMLSRVPILLLPKNRK
jgi:hypothetical protein